MTTGIMTDTILLIVFPESMNGTNENIRPLIGETLKGAGIGKVIKTAKSGCIENGILTIS